MIRSLTFSRSKWSSSRIARACSRSRLSSVTRAPRQREDPVQVRADHPVLRGGRRQLLEPRQLTAHGPVDLLGQFELIEPRAQLVHLRLLLVRLAELLLDRLQLLAQEVLALALLHLGLDLGLDLRAELEDLQLAVEDARDPPQASVHVGQLEQLLLLLGLDPQRRGDEMAESARVVDVRRGQLQLLGEVGNESDDASEEALDVPRQCLDLGRPRVDVRNVLEDSGQVRLVRLPLGDPDPAQALDEHAQGPVGNTDQLVHGRGCPDAVQVVPSRLFRVGVQDGNERELAVCGDDVVDQADGALLPDRQGRDRVREHDSVPQRQDRQLGHRRATWISTLAVRVRRLAIGKATVSRPCSYVAVAPFTSTPGASGIRRSNGPSSISIKW